MGPIRIVRHASYQKRFYDIVPAWIERNAPELAPLFNIRDLPCVPGEGVRLLVPWLQDPVEGWSAETYDFMMDMQARCDAIGVPVINRVERLANAAKARGAGIMAATGLRVPRTVAITDCEAFRKGFGGLAFPFFVREDWEHGGRILKADNEQQALAIPLERFKRPVASEKVDVRDPADGLCHKYRYFACGARGVSRHILVSESWVTRPENRTMTDATIAEELAYIERQDPFHDRFQAARRALGLDMVAFDYGIDRDGEPIVWEANAFPAVGFAGPETEYRNRAVHRSIAAMVSMYLERAGLPAVPAIEALVAY